MSFRVKVAIRVRPTNETQFLKCSETQITVPNGDKPPRKFAFDHVLNDTTTQQQLYEIIGQDLVSHAIEGYNSCIFAYGQTGSGKTHSVVGTPQAPGLVYNVCSEIFNQKSSTASSTACTVRLSMLEVYKEKVRDLFHKSAACKIRGTGNQCYVEGLTEITVNSISQVENLIAKGAKSRITAATNSNDESSRSHAVITLKITQQRPQIDDPFKTEEVVSSIRLVDLAGSERAGANSNSERVQEGSSINQSLVSLGRVIHTISQLQENPQAKMVVPYRDSVLTRLLQSSLAGNSRTTMLACVSNDNKNKDQTVNTLRYADQAKKMKTSAVLNKEMLTEADQSARLTKLQTELLDLRQQLDQERSNTQMQSLLKFYEDQAAREKVRISVLEAQKLRAETQHAQLGDFLREHLASQSVHSDFSRIEVSYRELQRTVLQEQEATKRKFEKWNSILNK